MLTFARLKGSDCHLYTQEHRALLGPYNKLFDRRKPSVLCHSYIIPSTACPATPATATTLLVLLLIRDRVNVLACNDKMPRR